MALHSGGESKPRLSMDVDHGVTEPCLINLRMNKTATKIRSNSIDTAKRRKLNESSEEAGNDQLLQMEKRILDAIDNFRNEIATVFERMDNKFNNLQSRLNILENKLDRSSCVGQSSNGVISYANIAAKGKNTGNLKLDIVKEVRHAVSKSLKDGSDKAQQIEYDPNKTVVIGQIENRKFLRSTEIKREISKVHNGVKIMKAYGTAKGKIVVQFENEDNAKQITENLNNNKIFGAESKAYRPLGNRNGIIKHVHRDITDNQIDEYLQQEYIGAKAMRLSKNGNILNTVKIQFASSEQLKIAMTKGLLIHPQFFQVLEFKSSANVEPIQCYNCQKFHRTVAKFCENATKCSYCSEGHESRNCLQKEMTANHKCANCNDNHSSNSKTCAIYLQSKDKLLQKTQDYGY